MARRLKFFALLAVGLAGCNRAHDICTAPQPPPALTGATLSPLQRAETAIRFEGVNMSPTDNLQPPAPAPSPKEKPDLNTFNRRFEAAMQAPPPPATKDQLEGYAKEANQNAKADYCLRKNAYMARNREESVEIVSKPIVESCGGDHDRKLAGYILDYRLCAKGQGEAVKAVKSD
jgi:hypothetical protein